MDLVTFTEEILSGKLSFFVQCKDTLKAFDDFKNKQKSV